MHIVDLEELNIVLIITNMPVLFSFLSRYISILLLRWTSILAFDVNFQAEHVLSCPWQHKALPLTTLYFVLTFFCSSWGSENGWKLLIWPLESWCFNFREIMERDYDDIVTLKGVECITKINILKNLWYQKIFDIKVRTLIRSNTKILLHCFTVTN